jgi:hypothetical protein
MRSTILLCTILTPPIAPQIAQSKAKESQTTLGDCSPNMANNSGTVSINCSHLDPAVASQIAEIVKQISTLNRKAATERNQQLILKTLQDINSSLKSAISGIQINAPIVQTSNGDCSPNFVGQGNTNTCAPKPVSISKEQAQVITDALKSAGRTSGTISINYEYSAPDGQQAAETLATR